MLLPLFTLVSGGRGRCALLFLHLLWVQTVRVSFIFLFVLLFVFLIIRWLCSKLWSSLEGSVGNYGPH